MFEILFGWRKASKCKKLIRRVQCRLKLLKNKRRCIVKQLREDVTELLKHGYQYTAFDRVEKLFIDQRMLKIYDVLENYCEFVVINLPYIRKHKDCPNEIKEAISTLIFASARFADLPELLTIRELFGKRYGESFAMAALELLPENLVNHQIAESLYIKNVPDDMKLRLVDDIGTSLVDSQLPLSLEYKPELENISVQISTDNIIEEKHVKSLQHNHDMVKFTIISEDSSSETISLGLPEEMVYLDDIEEVVSPSSKDENFLDQRLFVFKSADILLKEHENDMVKTCLDSGKRSRNQVINDEQENAKSGLRVTSMPLETPYGSSSMDRSVPRSNSFPQHQIKGASSYHQHIHPKLPDYDELAAKFMALKKLNLQKKNEPLT